MQAKRKILQTVCLLLALCGIASGAIVRHVHDFPVVSDCETTDIHLLLITDTATPTQEEYNLQLQFFSQIIDIFTPPEKDQTPHLSVGMVASTSETKGINRPNEEETVPVARPIFSFNKFKKVSDVKMAIQSDSSQITALSFPSATLMLFKNNLSQENFTFDSNATVIVIMIVDMRGDYIYFIEDELREFYSTSTSLYLIIVADLENLDLHRANALHVKNYLVVTPETLLHDQTIPIDLCQKCSRGWLRFKNTAFRVPSVSCYRLLTKGENYFPLEAVDACSALDSSLVYIESMEELEFLRLNMKNVCQSSRFESIEDLDECESNKTIVIIGLRRTQTDLARRFRWMNDLPLTVTHWLPSHPKGGFVQGCAAWIFEKGRTEEQTSGWFDIGCGQLLRAFPLCKSPRRPLLNQVQMLALKPASQQIIEAAVSRGEVGFCRHKDSLHRDIISSAWTDEDCYFYPNGNYSNISVSGSEVTKFPCKDSHYRTVAYSLVCDQRIDCENGMDEAYCDHRQCALEQEVMCASTECVPIDAVCDLYADCSDGSDEWDCQRCRNGLCSDGRCLPNHWLVDGETDCIPYFSTSIEEIVGVGHSLPSECALVCNTSACVSSSVLGDGIVDCLGPEGPIDETFGTLQSEHCYPGKNISSEWSPRCVYIHDRFDAVIGCRNMQHLQNCEYFDCPEGYVKCPQSYCIPIHFVRNGKPDCPRGEDEIDTASVSASPHSTSCDGNFACVSSSVCLFPELVCDGLKHCPRGDDELNCLVSCRDDFLCLQGTVAASGYDTSVPLNDLTFIDSRTRYLNLSGINISSTFPEVPRGHLVNILHMDLSGCSISSLLIPRDMNDFRMLTWFDLSANEIEALTDQVEGDKISVLYNTPSLVFLNMSHNAKLSYIGAVAFGHGNFLRVLDLSFTNLKYIPSKLFTSIPELTHLNLSHTSIHLPLFGNSKFVTLQELDLRGIDVYDVNKDIFQKLIIKSHLYTDSFTLCCPQLRGERIPSHTCHAPKDAFSSCSDLLERPISILLWFIGVTAFAGNLAVIVLRLCCDRKVLHMAYGQFVTHLGISDLLMGVYLLIIASVDLYYRDIYVWNEKEWRHSLMCHVAGFLSTLSNEVSTVFIFLITVDRYLVITYPFGQYRFSKFSTTASCITAWSFGFCIAIVPALPILDYWNVYTSNGMCLGLPLTKDRQVSGWHFSTAVFVFFNFVMFILIAFGQYAIFRSISNTNVPDLGLDLTARRERDLTIAKRLALIALSDLLCWFPIGVMGMMVLSGDHVGMEAYFWSAVFVLPINSAFNPIVYTVPVLQEKLSNLIITQIQRRKTL